MTTHELDVDHHSAERASDPVDRPRALRETTPTAWTDAVAYLSSRPPSHPVRAGGLPRRRCPRAHDQFTIEPPTRVVIGETP